MRYSVRADAAAKSVELDIFDQIGEPGFFYDAVSAKAVARTLDANKKAELIRMRVNSKGGDVLEGFAIYNMLAQHPARVEVTVVGIAASMASYIIMAADKVTMEANALWMMHNPAGVARGESKDLRAIADVWDKMRDSMAEGYASRSGIAKDKVLRMMDSETWLSAAEAKKKGFADAIVPAKAKVAAQARAYACVSAEDLADYQNAPDVLRTEVLNFASVGNSATFSAVDDVDNDIVIEVEDVAENLSVPAPVAPPATPDFAALLQAALGPIVADLGALKAQMSAGVAVKASADTATFAARVNAACEKHISLSKLTNSPESRAFFVAQAKDEATLSALDAHYTAAPPIVLTTALGAPEVSADSKPKLGPQALKLCADMGWDANKLFSKD